MKAKRSPILGNFSPLDRTLEAVASCISIEDSDADSHRSLNCRANDDPLHVKTQRKPIKQRLANAKAAEHLLRVLNKPANQRPEWREVTAGVALRDDSVGKQGLQWLIAHQQQAWRTVPDVHTKYDKLKEVPAVPKVPEATFAHRIGFDIDELIAFLDREGILHSLGPVNSTEMGKTIAKKDDVAPLKQVLAMGNHSSKRGRRSLIERQILAAQREAGGSFELDPVWDCLHGLAASGEHKAVLRLSPKGKIETMKADGWGPYRRDTLRQFLAKRLEKASK